MHNDTFPYWNQLPQIDLYLDQVLVYVNQVINQELGLEENILTAAMINNYVKKGYLQKPIKKKYGRQQIARLLVISYLKPVFSIQEIGQAIEAFQTDSEVLYNSFVEALEGNGDHTSPLIRAAITSLKNYYLTLDYIKALKEGDHGSN